jgi:sn1-specific diacylglycerol lipase
MPYYVVADHRTGSIVLVIRGSISMRDVFTDLNAGAEKFEAEWLPPNSMVSATVCVCCFFLIPRIDNKNSEGFVKNNIS